MLRIKAFKTCNALYMNWVLQVKNPKITIIAEAAIVSCICATLFGFKKLVERRYSRCWFSRKELGSASDAKQ